MKNYSTDSLKGLTAKNLQNHVFEYYRAHIQGKEVQNLTDKKITVRFNRIGSRKTAKPLMSISKAIAIIHLLELLKDAVYNNWGAPKPAHVKNYNAVGFLNFRAKCKIDGKQKSFRISIMQTKEMKFQYHLNEDTK